MNIFFNYLNIEKPESYLILQEGKDTANPFFELSSLNLPETLDDKKN